MFFEKRADAVFGGEQLRQRVLRAHRILEMIEPVSRHEKQVRHVQKRRHAAGGAMLVRLRRRRQQHVDGCADIPPADVCAAPRRSEIRGR